MPEPFLDDDAGFVRWRDSHPDGFILNHEREPKPAYLVLHRATCPHLRVTRGTNWTTAYAKTCAESTAELVAWARSETGGRPSSCGTCQPPI